MRKLLTLSAELRYDGCFPDRGSVGVFDYPPSGSRYPPEFKAVRVTLGTARSVSGRWGRELAVAIANVPTIDELANPPALSWQAVLGRADIKALARFVGRYGPVFASGSPKPGETLWEDPVCFAGGQFVLRKAWQGDEEAIALIAGEQRGVEQFIEKKTGKDYQIWADKDDSGKTITIRTKNFVHTEAGMPNGLRLLVPAHPIQAGVSVKTTGVEIAANSLWDFARLNFLRDHLMARTRVCANPNCVTPYFVYTRRRQIYCSHDCAVASASRNYRLRVKGLIEREKAEGRWPPKEQQ